MRKTEEVENPNSCLNKAQDDEPLFVLLGRDKAATATIRFWVTERIKLGLNKPGDPQILEALALVDLMVNKSAIEDVFKCLS